MTATPSQTYRWVLSFIYMGRWYYPAHIWKVTGYLLSQTF